MGLPDLCINSIYQFIGSPNTVDGSEILHQLTEASTVDGVPSPLEGTPYHLKCKKEGTSKQQKPGTSRGKRTRTHVYKTTQLARKERNPLVTKHRDRMFPGHTRTRVKNMTGSADSLMCLHHLVELTGISREGHEPVLARVATSTNIFGASICRHSLSFIKTQASFRDQTSSPMPVNRTTVSGARCMKRQHLQAGNNTYTRQFCENNCDPPLPKHCDLAVP